MSDPVVELDRDALTLTVTAEYPGGAERLWRVWADPRRLERWWGPPGLPARVTEHELRRGGRVRYVMTGPDGQTYPGFWEVTDVDPPTSLAFRDVFAKADGSPDPELPVTSNRLDLVPQDRDHCRMVLVTTFPSTDALRQLVDFGVEDGMRQAVAQIAGVLADQPG